jgi:hypothetical protein
MNLNDLANLGQIIGALGVMITLVNLAMLIAALVAGWAKPRWVQWTAAWCEIALLSWFLISSYTLMT